MHNIKLTLSYDGTDFHGWQIQPGQLTVQGLLLDVLQHLTQERLTVHGAGRTDAGVHAWGQVANFKTDSELAPKEFFRALNALLPPTVRVRAAQEIHPNFHARWLAQAKTYQYRIYRGCVVPPSRWRYVLHNRYALDFAAMAEAARCFEGERDFTSFAASSGSEERDRERSMVRTIYRSAFIRLTASTDQTMPELFAGEAAADSEEWIYVVRGKSFLRNMVRKIVGTLLEVGRGRIAPSDISSLLERRDATCSGPTAPAQGLWLVSVEYPEPTDSLDSLPAKPGFDAP